MVVTDVMLVNSLSLPHGCLVGLRQQFMLSKAPRVVSFSQWNGTAEGTITPKTNPSQIPLIPRTSCYQKQSNGTYSLPHLYQDCLVKIRVLFSLAHLPQRPPF